MNNENTPLNKAKFFAQYWGQEILKSNFNGTKNILSGLPYEFEFLELKPLSQITDEDAIEVVCLLHSENNFPRDAWKINRKPGGTWLINSIDEDYDTFLSSGEIEAYYDNNQDLFSASDIIDMLRSKGYALPFLGLSVEDQIDYGWIKLKNNTDESRQKLSY